MLRPEAIWKYTPGSPTNTYTDYTDNTKINTSITFIDGATQYFYIGFPRRFIGMFFDLSTNGSYTSVVYEFYNGTQWDKLSLIDSYSLSESKYLRWVLPDQWQKYRLTDEEPHTATPPDDVERYWVRVSVSAVTTAAVISEMRVIPYVIYSTPTKVSQMLQFKKDFTHSTVPTDLSVEDIVRRAEDRIDYRTRKSWRFNAVTEDYDPTLVDYNRYGIFLRHRNFRKVYSIKLWDGGSWETLSEGRNNDYFVNYNLGMIYFTRLFLLPAAYGISGRYFHYGFGEFKNSVQVDYVYGRDPEVDKEFFIVEDIATKMASIDILKHHDYSGMIVSGSDKVDLNSKIRFLEDEVEMRLDELTGAAIF
jgi:hypothetical protein